MSHPLMSTLSRLVLIDYYLVVALRTMNFTKDNAKFLTERYCPMITAARRNPRVCGILSDNSDHRLVNDPEFEEIRNQAMAFEKWYDMASEVESYVGHVQKFPDRT